MALATFVIPIAPHHAEVAQRAIDSALGQTIPSEVVSAVDEEGIGAGAMRNLLMQTANTPFVVFLDADDEVMPNFVEQTVFAYERGKYVYTAWLDDEGKLHEAPPESRGGVFAQGQFHTITTLLPTALFRLAGGFDETLAGLEDVDLFMKLQTLGVCGVRCPAPLMRYNRKLGKRASGVRASGQREQILDLLTQRYEGKLRMCDCGPGMNSTQPPANEQQPGDVLVEALYAPQIQQGRVSGRKYPRTGNHRQLYVDPRDVAASPELWQTPPEIKAEIISPAVDTVTALANAALEAANDTPVGTAAVDGVEIAPSADAPVDDESRSPYTWEDYSDEDKATLAKANKPRGGKK